MKIRFTRILAALALLVFMTPSLVAWGQTKITDYSRIVSGKKYYIGATVSGTDYYFYADGSSVGQGIQGTSKTDKTQASVLVFEGSGTSWSIKFFDSGNYLSLKDQKDNGKVKVVATAENWTVSNVSNLIQLKINGYLLQKNSGTSLNFGSYASGQKNVWLEEISESIVATPTFSPAEGTYFEAQNVTITCATTGATLQYKLTENGQWQDYTAAIHITETTTIWAKASLGEESSEASATYTFPITIAAVRTQATGSVFTKGIMTYISGKNAYIQDATAAICVYGSSNSAWNNYAVGDEIAVSGSLTTFGSGNMLEIQNPSATRISQNNPLPSVTKTIAEINTDAFTDLQCMHVKIENATVTEINGSNTTISQTIGGVTSTIVVYSSDFDVEEDDVIASFYANVGYYSAVQLVNPTDVQMQQNPTITTNAVNNSLAVPNQILGSYDGTGFATLTVNGANLTEGITLTLGTNSPFEMSTNLNEWLSTVTIPQTGGSITNQEVAIRLKESLTTVQEYSDNVTLTSTGATDVTVALTGSVTNQIYTLTDESGDNGSISFSASAAEAGAHVTLTATPASDAYYFVPNSWSFFKDDLTDVTEDIEFVSGETNVIVMPAYNLHVDASFQLKPTYDITAVASPTDGGAVVTDETAWAGKEVTVLVSANNGYAFTGIVVSKTDEASTTTEISGNINDGFTFTMPAYEVTVTATFEMNLNVTYDFTSLNNFYIDANLTNHPSSGGDNNYDDLYYTNGDHFTASGTNRYFYVSGSNCCFLFGKSGALVNLPIFSNYKITRIIIHSSTGHSTSVNVGIVDNEDNVVAVAQNWETKDHDYTYVIPAAYQQSALSVKVTNGYNAQFTSITLVREIPSTDPSIDVEDEITIAHDATYGEFPYTIVNPTTGVILQATSATDWITNVAVTNDKVTFTTTANPSTEEDRTGTITLSYTGAQSKTVSINQGKKVIDYAELPFTFTGGWNDIDNTVGLTDDGLGSDYGTSAKLKFDDSGDWVILKLNEAPTSLSYDIKGNSLSGNYQFDVLVSANGVNYETLASYTPGNINNSKVITITHINLASEVRYIKWIYTTKASGNVGMGNIRATANYDIYGTVTVADLAPTDNKKCTIYEGGALIVTGTMTNTSTANFIIEDGGQYTGNSVAARMKKHIDACTYSSDNNTGYILIASPMNGLVYNNNAHTNLTANNYDLYAYVANPSDGKEWHNFKETANNLSTLNSGQGYLYANSTSFDLLFMGNTNTTFSDVQLPYEEGDLYKSLYLAGNTLPHAETFYVVKDANSESQTVNFLTINNEGSGFTTTSASSLAVQPMQGFFVQATTSEALTLTTQEPQQAPAGDALLNIMVSRNRGAVIDNAIVSFGNAPMMNKFRLTDNATELFVPMGSKDMTVVNAQAEGELPVSFRAAENGTYTLTVNPEGVEMNYLHLIDNMTGADVDLLATPSYTFEAKTSDYASRFRLVFSANNTDEDGASTGSATFAYFNGSNWTVSNMGEATLQVVDVMGRVLSSETLSGNAEVSINQPTGVYMLRLVSGDSVKVQKVVVR